MRQIKPLRLVPMLLVLAACLGGDGVTGPEGESTGRAPRPVVSATAWVIPITDLGTLGSLVSEAWAINDHGQVVGRWQGGAFLW